ncbi:MAG: arginine--tRNA ligase [Patescibacteria group bacterium]|nr:arginine--tRNA ligase [Patescibacteria group bacterium]
MKPVIKEIKDFVGKKVSQKFDVSLDVEIEHPQDLDHGDFATNIAFKLANSLGKAPREIAEDLVNDLFVKEKLPSFISSVEVAGPGFINFWLSKEFFLQEVHKILEDGDKYGSSKIGQGKNILLEHTSPDPIKTIHVGHLRNNFLGMAAARLLEKCGYSVIKDCIDNDRGTHVSRAMWGFLVFGRKSLALSKKQISEFAVEDSQIEEMGSGVNWRELLSEWIEFPQRWYKPEDLDLKPDHFDLRFYSLGDRAEILVSEVEGQVREMLQSWEKKDKAVRELWKQIINWSHKGYEQTYNRIGSEFDHVWRESEIYEDGRKVVEKGVEKGIFKCLNDGAVLSDLSDYGLSDAILLRSDGTTLYHTLDLALTKKKKEKFPSDLYIWCIGNDQILYLKQLFAMCEQLGIGSREQFCHLNFGYVNLKGGERMSSRTGTIVSADRLLDLLHKDALLLIESSDSVQKDSFSLAEREEVAEAIALGALKYGLLKYSREKDTEFDPEESVTLEGDSGPYLQYSYARCYSVLKKAEQKEFDFGNVQELKSEEESLLRTLYLYPEVIEDVQRNFGLNRLCSFLYDLAQKYNSFYNSCPILNAESREARNLRLALTFATAQIIKDGLSLLGIKVLKKL